MNRILLFFIIPFFLFSQNEKEIFTMFYNVENLFDTINNPLTEDDEFLPGSKKKWNTNRYNQKINQLTKVFSSINNGYQPNLIGLCEVENKNVIQDLLKTSFFQKHNYTIIHQESADNRGIDCAILFDHNFQLLKHEFIKIQIPNASRPTRDIIYVQLQLEEEIVNIFINHWPSRWGGQEKTNYKRVFTARVLRNYIDKYIDPTQSLIIMGDLNDYPSNESLKNILVKDDFFNLMDTDKLKGMGSYNYKGDWNFLDHIIVSKNFLNQKNKIHISDYGVFKEEWLLYRNKENQLYPSRTYGGTNWYGGFSDHLAIYCKFQLKKGN